jgi:hypothetical protein
MYQIATLYVTSTKFDKIYLDRRPWSTATTNSILLETNPPPRTPTGPSCSLPPLASIKDAARPPPCSPSASKAEALTDVIGSSERGSVAGILQPWAVEGATRATAEGVLAVAGAAAASQPVEEQGQLARGGEAMASERRRTGGGRLAEVS